jgi:hypothetical protein
MFIYSPKTNKSLSPVIIKSTLSLIPHCKILFTFSTIFYFFHYVFFRKFIH